MCFITYTVFAIVILNWIRSHVTTSFSDINIYNWHFLCVASTLIIDFFL